MDHTDHADAIPLNNIDSHVGARLRARRQMIRMSEEWLAAFLEVSEPQLCAIEEGRARIGYDDLLRVCEVVGVPERYFYQGVDGKPPSDPNGEGKRSWLRDVDRWFRDHVSPHEGLFLTVARRLLGNRETARDVVHDAYAKVLADERWRTVENPRAYVNRTVANLALNVIQRSKIVPIEAYADAESEVMAIQDLAPDAYQNVADRERLSTVMAALDKLAPKTRQVFLMRRVEDLPAREIAERLGISLTTVEWHMSEGIKGLRGYLEAHRKSGELRLWLARQQIDSGSKPARKDRP